MTKPFSLEAMLAKVPAALERKRALRINDLYLGILVHDIKNPLQYLTGAIEFLEESLRPNLDESHRRLFHTAEFGIGQIRTIVSNILAISRFENGTFRVDLLEFPIREVVEGVTRFFGCREQGDDRGIRTVFAQADLVKAFGDRNLYEQVLSNIVANAMRYAQPDSEVRVWCGSDGETVTTSVMNTGSFIPEPYRASIFDKFAAVQSAGDTLRGQNFGLGLTFSKMAVEAMGGRIWVESDQAVPETTFFFTVPAVKC
jgi:signal transduction histidine kinase